MAVPPELLSALSASGLAAAAGAQGDIPPDLLAALRGGEAGGALEPAPGDEGGLYGSAGGDNVEALRAALDALEMYAKGEDDEQNIQVVLKCITALQGILAEEQKMLDGALSGRLDPRSLRRVAAQQGGGLAY
ncbi:MAG: hypothetical protein KatS3mg015_2799 [Fimbriimonadales bacterium]|nr:MAG: hypothetical protein KatS3mg015_2799 [Fimbriimonadales bacterium]